MNDQSSGVKLDVDPQAKKPSNRTLKKDDSITDLFFKMVPQDERAHLNVGIEHILQIAGNQSISSQQKDNPFKNSKTFESPPIALENKQNTLSFSNNQIKMTFQKRENANQNQPAVEERLRQQILNDEDSKESREDQIPPSSNIRKQYTDITSPHFRQNQINRQFNQTLPSNGRERNKKVMKTPPQQIIRQQQPETINSYFNHGNFAVQEQQLNQMPFVSEYDDRSQLGRIQSQAIEETNETQMLFYPNQERKGVGRVDLHQQSLRQEPINQQNVRGRNIASHSRSRSRNQESAFQSIGQQIISSGVGRNNNNQQLFHPFSTRELFIQESEINEETGIGLREQTPGIINNQQLITLDRVNDVKLTGNFTSANRAQVSTSTSPANPVDRVTGQLQQISQRRQQQEIEMTLNNACLMSQGFFSPSYPQVGRGLVNYEEQIFLPRLNSFNPPIDHFKESKPLNIDDWHLAQLERQDLHNNQKDAENLQKHDLFPTLRHIGSLNTINFVHQVLLLQQNTSDYASAIAFPDSIMIELNLSKQENIPTVTQLQSIDGQIIQQKLKCTELEQVLFQWLNKNFSKQKTGTFIPLCTLKWSIQDSIVDYLTQKQSTESSKGVIIDFFVASTLQFLNSLCDFWRRKNIPNKTLRILLQRYLPVKQEYSWIVRMHWRKQSGFRMYRYEHTHLQNSPESLNYQALSELYDSQITKMNSSKISRTLSKIKKIQNQQFTNVFQAINKGQEGAHTQMMNQQKQQQLQIFGQESVTSSMSELYEVATETEKALPALFNNKRQYISQVNKNHIILNWLLTQDQTKFTQQFNQFTVNPDNNPNLFKKTKLHYESQPCKTNELIGQCKRALNKLRKSLDLYLLQNAVDKLVLDFLPEHCYKDHTTMMSLLQIQEIVLGHASTSQAIIGLSSTLQPQLLQQEFQSLNLDNMTPITDKMYSAIKDDHNLMQLTPELRYSYIREQQLIADFRQKHLKILNERLNQSPNVMKGGHPEEAYNLDANEKIQSQSSEVSIQNQDDDYIVFSPDGHQQIQKIKKKKVKQKSNEDVYSTGTAVFDVKPIQKTQKSHANLPLLNLQSSENDNVNVSEKEKQPKKTHFKPTVLKSSKTLTQISLQSERSPLAIQPLLQQNKVSHKADEEIRADDMNSLKALIKKKSSEFINEIISQAESVQDDQNSILNKFEKQVEDKLAKMETEFKQSLERLEDKNQQRIQIAKFEKESQSIFQELKAQKQELYELKELLMKGLNVPQRGIVQPSLVNIKSENSQKPVLPALMFPQIDSNLTNISRNTSFGKYQIQRSNLDPTSNDQSEATLAKPLPSPYIRERQNSITISKEQLKSDLQLLGNKMALHTEISPFKAMQKQNGKSFKRGASNFEQKLLPAFSTPKIPTRVLSDNLLGKKRPSPYGSQRQSDSDVTPVNDKLLIPKPSFKETKSVSFDEQSSCTELSMNITNFSNNTLKQLAKEPMNMLYQILMMQIITHILNSLDQEKLTQFVQESTLSAVNDYMANKAVPSKLETEFIQGKLRQIEAAVKELLQETGSESKRQDITEEISRQVEKLLNKQLESSSSQSLSDHSSLLPTSPTKAKLQKKTKKVSLVVPVKINKKFVIDLLEHFKDMDESNMLQAFTEICKISKCKEMVEELLQVEQKSSKRDKLSNKSKTIDPDNLTSINKTKLSLEFSDMTSSDFKLTHSVQSKDELGDCENVVQSAQSKKRKKLDRGQTQQFNVANPYFGTSEFKQKQLQKFNINSSSHRNIFFESSQKMETIISVPQSNESSSKAIDCHLQKHTHYLEHHEEPRQISPSDEKIKKLDLLKKIGVKQDQINQIASSKISDVSNMFQPPEVVDPYSPPIRNINLKPILKVIADTTSEDERSSQHTKQKFHSQLGMFNKMQTISSKKSKLNSKSNSQLNTGIDVTSEMYEFEEED